VKVKADSGCSQIAARKERVAMSGIVVGIDGSHNAGRALEWAMAEAATRNAELTVITVNSVPVGYWSGHPVTVPSDEVKVAEARKAAEAAVTNVAEALGDSQPASVTVIAVNGFPAQTLINASENCDLLVVGTRGGGGFGSLVMGSICNQVVHHAKCPVVVVPGASGRA
jgi:nucleotide-binding universal stress UspA family protein